MKWIKASERLPDKEGVYAIKFLADKELEIARFISGNVWWNGPFQCNVNTFEWLDESPDDLKAENERLMKLLEEKVREEEESFYAERYPDDTHTQIKNRVDKAWLQFKTEHSLIK